jgi:rRNA processing protein Gar1
LKNWIKLNLFYVGKSKKHFIFRAKRWDIKLERLFKTMIFNEKYQNIGYIKDIFGPIESPFISIKALPNQEFNPNDKLYAKLN